MKTNRLITLLVGSLCFAQSVTGQAPKLNIGIDTTTPEGQLAILNRKHFDASTGFALPLRWTEVEPHAKLHWGAIDFSVRHSPVGAGSTSSHASLEDLTIWLEMISVEGPLKGRFAYWEKDAEEPTFTLRSGETAPVRWRLNPPTDSTATNPGKVNRQRLFTATVPGIYTVTFRALAEARPSDEKTSVPLPSEPIQIRFAAGELRPVNLRDTGHYVVRFLLEDKRLVARVFQDDEHSDHDHGFVLFEHAKFGLTNRQRGHDTPPHSTESPSLAKAMWTIPKRDLSLPLPPVLDGNHMHPQHSASGDAGHSATQNAHATHTSQGHHGAHGQKPWDGDQPAQLAINTVREVGARHRVSIETKHFLFSPYGASGPHVAGQGHAHVYLDGIKLGRVYGHDYLLPPLAEGPHSIRVTLNANTHDDYTIDGRVVEASTTVEAEPPTLPIVALDQSPTPWTKREKPTANLQVSRDRKKGWNLFLVVQGITLNAAQGSHKPGEGLAEILVNDQVVTRLCGSAYHLGKLPNGYVNVAVRFTTNDQHPYIINGEPLQVTQRIRNFEGPQESDTSLPPMTLTLSTMDLPRGTLQDQRLELQVSSLSGPGPIQLTPDSTKNAKSIVAPGSTSRPFALPEALELPVSWRFTTPGDYDLTLKATGSLKGDGGPLSTEIVLPFRVVPSHELHHIQQNAGFDLTWDIDVPLERASHFEGPYEKLTTSGRQHRAKPSSTPQYYRLRLD